jgi:hypothetical protein
MPINGKIALGKAIKAINADAKYTYLGDDIDTIEWLNDTAPVSKEDILAKQAELQAEYDAQDYARKRKVEYPDIYDYIDGIVKSDQAQIDKYIADCQAVKDKYSKGA